MSTRTEIDDRSPLATLALRGAFGGVLMGLANLVPGISGGTMLVAAGVYTWFIQAIAEVTALRFRVRPLVVLASVAGSAALAIVLLAGPVKDLVTSHRWIMYSLFIGLTIGGVPLVWRMARPASVSVFAGAAAGFGAMLVMFFSRAGAGGEGNPLMLVAAGIAGASAMILPGVSGAYLLLVLGQYEVILGAIDHCRRGLAGDTALLAGAMAVVLPVGVGVVVGIVGISNLIRWALRRYEKPTLGVLLGLLLGSVLGVWPFQETAGHAQSRVYFSPGTAQAIVALALAAAGFGITVLIDRLGGGPRRSKSAGAG